MLDATMHGTSTSHEANRRQSVRTGANRANRIGANGRQPAPIAASSARHWKPRPQVERGGSPGVPLFLFFIFFGGGV